MQIVRSDGTTIFPFGGRAVSTVLSQKGPVGILPSDSMSSLVIWWDFRTAQGNYAQRVDTLGNALWNTTDVAVSLPGATAATVTTDGKGGFILINSNYTDSAIRAQQVGKHGHLGEVIASASAPEGPLPKNDVTLFHNYPNPFNSATTLSYQLSQRGNVRLTIYNLLGQEVTTLFAGMQQSGDQRILFNAANLPSGVYLYKLETAYGWAVRKLIIIK